MSGLFDSVNLGMQDDFIEIPDKGATPISTEDVEDKTPGKKVVEPIEDEENFIDVKIGTTPKTFIEDEESELDKEGFVEVTDDKTPPSKTKGSSSSSPFKPFAKALSEEGFLPSFEDEEFDKLVEELGGETEALMELSRRSINEDIETYKREADEDFRNFLEARDAGLDLGQWADVYEAKKAYAGITEDKIDDDEALQKALITENLKYRGMADDEIADTIEAYETTGKLADNAKKAHKNLIKITDQQELKLKEDKVKQENATKLAREENLKSLRKEVDTITEIVPGIKINKQTKDKIFSSITTPVKTGTNGEPMNLAMVKRAENPLKYAIIENYLIEMGVFDGNWDKISVRQKSKAVAELEAKLKDGSNTNFASGKSTLGSGGSDDDIEFSLGNFK